MKKLKSPLCSCKVSCTYCYSPHRVYRYPFNRVVLICIVMSVDTMFLRCHSWASGRIYDCAEYKSYVVILAVGFTTCFGWTCFLDKSFFFFNLFLMIKWYEENIQSTILKMRLSFKKKISICTSEENAAFPMSCPV